VTAFIATTPCCSLYIAEMRQTLRATNPVFVDAQWSQVCVKQQLLWIDVDWRLSFALRTDVPIRVDEAPEIWPCAQHAWCLRSYAYNCIHKLQHWKL